MSYTYTTWGETLANLCGQATTSNPEFEQYKPSVIMYAENRMYRELNLLATVIRDTSSTLTPNSRNFTLPSGSGRFVVVYGVNVFTPALTTDTRVQLVPTTRDAIDQAWPSETAASETTVPTMWAPITDQTLIVGPPPGDSYTVEVIGTIRPTALSEDNPTTYLSTYLPDAFMAASMISMTGSMKNWGAQGDDPKMALSWENQYQTLMKGVSLQDAQQKFAAISWTSQEPQPYAQPQRG
jgi:hypothetical protein